MSAKTLQILHTNFLKGWGGQSNRILEESYGVAQAGHRVVLSAPPESQLLQRAESLGLEVLRTVQYQGGLRPSLLMDVLALRRILSRNPWDILHLHGGRDSLIAALALQTLPPRARPQVIRTKHNVFPIHHHFGNRWLYGSVFQHHVALSGAIVQQLLETTWIAEDRITKIPSAIDPQRFVPKPEIRDRLRAEFGFTPDHKVLAMVGRFRSEKGHDILLQAAPAVISAHPTVRFLLLGAGSDQQQAQKLVAKFGLENHVLLPGFRKDIPDCLQAADYYVQPSRSEGLGTGVLEAGASGLPIVASRVGGIPDIICTRDHGTLVEPENPDAFAEGILSMLSQPDRARSQGETVKTHILKEFSLIRLIERTLQLYERVSENKK